VLPTDLIAAGCALDENLRQPTTAQRDDERRRIIGSGEAVTAVNTAGGEIGARAWRWDVDDAGQPRTIVVLVSGQAHAEQSVRAEVAAALETRGRFVVEGSSEKGVRAG
jgi:hypothetical protein